MKKLTVLLSAFVFLLLLCACTRNYSYQAEEGPFIFMYGRYFPRASTRNPDGVCVNRYTWDGDSGNTDIVIPDEYASQAVGSLGGYFGKGLPCPFFIDDTSCLGLHDDNEDTHDLGCLSVPFDMLDELPDEWSELVCHDFDLYLGKSIDTIFSDPCVTIYTVNGVKTAYCPRVRVHCDEKNGTFFSKNGRLYYRDSGELVMDFIYAD